MLLFALGFSLLLAQLLLSKHESLLVSELLSSIVVRVFLGSGRDEAVSAVEEACGLVLGLGVELQFEPGTLIVSLINLVYRTDFGLLFILTI